jgi:hypothetical protein
VGQAFEGQAIQRGERVSATRQRDNADGKGQETAHCSIRATKNADGSLTLYIQKDSPGKAKEANWLPAPNDTAYVVMRLYWPKETPPSILPPGEGTWKPPGIVASK